jgi:choline dehydrogenase
MLAGHNVNLDNNDGDPLGISIARFNVAEGARVTSTTAFLESNVRSHLGNLVILKSTPATKLLLENKRVIGIEVLPAIEVREDFPIAIYCSKEVILTAGCFQAPQLLLLSGIGPAEECAAHGIPLLHELPPVGRNLQDHSALACESNIKPSIAGHNQLLNDSTHCYGDRNGNIPLDEERSSLIFWSKHVYRISPTSTLT